MLNKIAIIVQARTGSQRLPDKVILPFYNQFSILDIIIQRLKNNIHQTEVILATTTHPNDNIIVETAIKHQINVFRGDEHNVINRFVKCADTFNVQKIIRVCADNPFILLRYIDELIQNALNTQYDYISYKNFENTPVIKTHFGLFAEYVNTTSLKKVLELTNDDIYLEHVTNFIYTHPKFFNIKWFNLPDLIFNRKDLRFTCDTIDDYNMLKKLYHNYLNTYNTDDITLENLLLLVNNHNEFIEVMTKGIKQFNK